ILCTPLADQLLFPLLLLGHDVLWPPTYGFACFHDRCSVLVCPPQTPDRYPSAHPGSRRDLVSAVTYAAFCSGFSAGRVEPGHPVHVVPAARGSLDVQIKAIGTVTPLHSVVVRSRVDGELLRVHFNEGSEVEQGALLAEIDPAPYRARLAQAEGQAQQIQAQLANARADLELYEGLWEQDSIARQQLTSQRALVEELQGSLKANTAQVEDARLQLSWTRIVASIAGRLGLRRIDPGNQVSSG